jgi:hypothetical protein
MTMTNEINNARDMKHVDKEETLVIATIMIVSIVSLVFSSLVLLGA